MDARDRSRVFGEVADVYERVRRPYPEELFDELLDYAGRPPRALDVGAGTGRATGPLVARGLRVTAIEPDAAMAAVLARRVPDARVERCAFEDYRPSSPFGLVCSAEAWHWTAPATRWELARAALAGGGTFALLWNNERLAEPAMQEAFVRVFAEVAPTVTIKDLSVTPERAWSRWPGDELAAADGFTDLTSRHYLTRTRVSIEDFQGLTRTRSQFRMLPAGTRERVMERLARLFGDEAPMAVDTTLLLARLTPGGA